MTSENKVTITESLLDAMVGTLATMPYDQVQPIFQRMGQELAAAEQNSGPKIQLVNP